MSDEVGHARVLGEELKDLGITPDTLTQKPEEWVAFVQRLGSDISLGDLMRVGLVQTPEQAAAGKLEADAKAGRERTSLGETTIKEAEKIQQVATGSGEFGALADALAENIESSRGADMTWDIDTAQGSAGALDFYTQLKNSKLGTILGRAGVAEAVLARLKGDMVGNLRGLPKDAQGRMIVSENWDVDGEAVVNMQTLIRAAAEDLGVTPGDVLKTRLGLDYSGLDDQSYGAALLKRAGGDPGKVKAMLDLYGLRLQ